MEGRCSMIGLALTLIILGYYMNRCIIGVTEKGACRI